MTITDKDVVEISQQGYVTLEQIDELVVTEADVETAEGRFRVRALSFQEFIETKERAKEIGGVTDDADIPEWEATRELLLRSIVEPDFSEDEDELLGRLAPKTVGQLVEAITKISGMEDDVFDDDGNEIQTSFSGGSRTG